MTSPPRDETGADHAEVPSWVNRPHEGERRRLGAHGPRVDPGPRAEQASPAGTATRVSDEQPVDEAPGAAMGGARSRRQIHRHELEGLRSQRPHHDRRRRPGRWARRIAATLALVVALGLICAVGAVVWLNGHLSGSVGEPVTVTLPDGVGHATLAAALVHDGVVRDAWLFRRYLDYEGLPPVAAGDYVVHRHEGYQHALHDLHAGPKITKVKLTIPEGYDLSQIAAAVGKLPGRSADRFTAAVTSGAVRSRYEPAGVGTLEGLLFPDTYFVKQDEDEQTILQHMVDRFDEVAGSIGLDNSAATNGLNPYQTVIMASLIEKEAKLDEDRPMIARVITNRLAKNMRLQIDATVLYAEGVHKTRVLNSDLATNSPYNTYKVAGLPPGPIAAPGKASLQAALNPTPGTWLYYVLIDPSGKHGFATTDTEFNRLRAEAKAKGLL